MNVCPEWLCGTVKGAKRARNDSWWKDKGEEGGAGGHEVESLGERGRMSEKNAGDKDGEEGWEK